MAKIFAPVSALDSPDAWPLEVKTFGIVPYEDALAAQHRLHAERVHGATEDTLLLLEHPHVYTLGRNSDPQHILVDESFLLARGATVAHNERGGEVTYHGPGQLVAYPIILLRQSERSITLLVERMEAAIIATLAEFGLAGSLVAGEPGVWVGDSKIASIGMAVRRWVVLHGMALNVSTNLNYFTYIDPCGHAGMAVTSIERELGSAPNMALVASSFARHFCSVFGRVMRSDRPLYESDGIKT